MLCLVSRNATVAGKIGCFVGKGHINARARIVGEGQILGGGIVHFTGAVAVVGRGIGLVVEDTGAVAGLVSLAHRQSTCISR